MCLNVSLWGQGKGAIRRCPKPNMEEKVEPKRNRTGGPSAYQTASALPLGQTGSHAVYRVRMLSFLGHNTVISLYIIIFFF